MPTNSCPSPETLRDWALGNLSNVQSDDVLDHIDMCSHCEELLSRIEVPQQIGPFDDTNDFRREAECTDLVNLLTGETPAEQHHGPNTDDLSGRHIRDYQLIKQLGRGGMGTVYQARHTRLNKLVAIKLVPEHSHEDPSALARFEREMQAVGLLDHPNVVAALDAGDADGMYFLTMELVEGTDLSRLIKEQRQLSVADACEIARQAADGMQYAHEQGLIHRDIKPSNLMLAQDQDDRVVIKILDLGLATMPETADSITSLTDQNLLVGTLEYMAPEQCDDSNGIDHRADIYSLGATLYRLLTGSVPFSGPQFRKPARRLFALTTLDAPAIATRRDDLPRELTQLVDSMLTRDRAFRPKSMAEVSKSLARFSSNASLKMLLTDLPVTRTDDERTIQSDALHPAVALADTSPTAARTISVVRPESPVVAQTSGAANGNSGRWKWLALAAIVPAFILAAVIWISNNGGYIRVEHGDDIDLILEVIRNGEPHDTIDLKQTDEAVFYRTGNYEFRIPTDKRNSIRLENGSFYLERNGQQVVKISHVARRDEPEKVGRLSLSDGLVAMWLFDDVNADVVHDASGNGLHGQPSTAIPDSSRVTGVPVSQHGHGLRLEGSNHSIVVADTPALNLTKELTVAMWIRGEIAADSVSDRVVSKQSPTDGYSLSVFGAQSRNPGRAVFNTAKRNASGNAAKSKTIVLDGQWHHVVGTFDGINLNIYVDGKLEGSRMPGHLMGTNNTVLRIGSNAQSEFLADVDDVCVFNRALSSDEVTTLNRHGHTIMLPLKR